MGLGTFTQILVVASVLQFTLRADDQAVKVTEEPLPQHEEQLSQEMARLQEMEHRSRQLLQSTQESLLLSACEHWWFWASADVLLVLFAFCWLPRQGSSGCHSSAGEETPAVPRRKRRRRRRKRMRGVADYGEKLDHIRSPDLGLEWKDMQNAEEEVEGMINASAKPFPQETFGQSCIQGIQ